MLYKYLLEVTIVLKYVLQIFTENNLTPFRAQDTFATKNINLRVNIKNINFLLRLPLTTI